MKNILFLSAVLLTTSISTAQTLSFTLADPQPNLIDVYGGSLASGDIDGDGDLDLLMAGLDPGRETALYLNDGAGNFTEATNIPFPEASNTVTLFEDLDGDGDLDLFFSGVGSGGLGEFTHIYLNDGSGTFNQLANPSLPEFAGKGAALGDVDGDGDQDLMISVEDANGVFVADLYLNNGAATFTPAGNTVFTAVRFASIAFIDVENDGDADLIISGQQPNDEALTQLYLNDGSGNFSVDSSSNFVQLKADDIDVADTDNDGDFDILTSGTTDTFDVRTILYVNDGTGQFAELTSSNLQQTFAGTNAIADLDNDGDQDIVIIGSQDGGLPNIYNKVYQNMGNNVFDEVQTIGGEYIAACAVDDFNGDGLSDIIIQGFVDRTNVYWNSSTVLGIAEETAFASQLSLYPNPSNGALTVATGATIPTEIKVYSSLGALVHSQTTNETSTNELTLNQPAGMYFVVVTSNEATATRKLILN